MRHATAWTLLQDYLDGELSKSRSADVRAHLAECEACRTEIAALEELMRRAAGMQAKVSPPHDLWPGVQAAIADTAPAASEPRGAFRPAIARWWQAAAESMSAARRSRAFWPALAAAGLVLVLLVPLALDVRMPGLPAGDGARVADGNARDRGGALAGDAATGAAPAGPMAGGELGDDGLAGAALDANGPTTAMLAALDEECRGVDEQFARLATADQTKDHPLIEFFQSNLRIVDQAIADAREAWRANPDSPQLVRMLVAAYQAKTALQGRASQVVTRT